MNYRKLLNLSNEELICLLERKSHILFIQASLSETVDGNVWIEVYTLVFIMTIRELDLSAYQVLCDICTEPPSTTFNLINDVKILPKTRQKLFLHLVWALNKISGRYYIPREIKLRIFFESQNTNLLRGYKVVFTAFQYLNRFMSSIHKQIRVEDDKKYLWGHDLLKQHNKNFI